MVSFFIVLVVIVANKQINENPIKGKKSYTQNNGKIKNVDKKAPILPTPVEKA